VFDRLSENTQHECGINYIGVPLTANTTAILLSKLKLELTQHKYMNYRDTKRTPVNLIV